MSMLVPREGQAPERPGTRRFVHLEPRSWSLYSGPWGGG